MQTCTIRVAVMLGAACLAARLTVEAQAQYAPTNLRAVGYVVSGNKLGDVITCKADASPPATFVWLDMDPSLPASSPVGSGASLTVMQFMAGLTMRCYAYNNPNAGIQGAPYLDVLIKVLAKG